MITTKSKSADFLTEFTDGTHTGLCDAPADKGGADAGFTPFSLLEASLAGCLNITLRVYAKNHGIDLGDVECTVTLVSGDDGSTFEYSVKLPEGFEPKVKKRLLAALKGCPIHGLLAKPMDFKLIED
ncbi:OsmC family protein [Pseudodesulfovibrio sp.]|uniref:OsmC family protein n=1 Tax=unclassified Pseudodesulfovibrio TaxID=2661612 RepID=UPI003B00186A